MNYFKTHKTFARSCVIYILVVYGGCYLLENILTKGIVEEWFFLIALIIMAVLGIRKVIRDYKKERPLWLYTAELITFIYEILYLGSFVYWVYL